MKILLLGASGLVGSATAKAALRSDFSLTAAYNRWPVDYGEKSRSVRANLEDSAAISRLVEDTAPDVIINAAGISQGSQVLANPQLAQRLNVDLPRHLASLARLHDLRFLHLSTDMVFDGRKGAYQSTDAPHSLSLYAEQKVEAEDVVLQEAPDQSAILRITLVNGNSPRGDRSVHECLFKAWMSGQITRLFVDEFRQPVSANSVAEILCRLAKKPEATGLFHWAGADTLSRYEIGEKIRKKFSLPSYLIEKISIKNLPNPRSRPADLSMNLQPLDTDWQLQPETFDHQLEELTVPPQYCEWHRKNSEAGPQKLSEAVS